MKAFIITSIRYRSQTAFLRERIKQVCKFPASRIALFSFCFLVTHNLCLCQIKGVVTDQENHNPLIGAVIQIKGTETASVTDFDGQFEIEGEAGNELMVTYLGYTSKTVLATEGEIMEISLEPGILMNEIVVTGYSVDSRRNIPGSAATVSPAALAAVPSGNVDQQLQGRVSGLTVVTNGQPGTESQVRIRGFGALAGNRPLYVVDGVPVESVNFLAPGDIETVTILKDATAAALYGARAAGGVIVFTTKGGQVNDQKMSVTYEGTIGVTTPGKGHEVLSPQDQAHWMWTGIRNAAIARNETPEFNSIQYGNGDQPVIPDYLLVGDRTGVVGSINLEDHRSQYNIDPSQELYQVVRANKEGTDWYDAITRTALMTRHHLGLSGSSNGNEYYLGLSMQNQEGILINQKLNRYSLRANSRFKITEFLSIGENFQSTYRSSPNLIGEGGLGSADASSPILLSYLTPPIIPLYDEFGGYAGNRAGGLGNFGTVLPGLKSQNNNRDFSTSFFGNAFLELEPIEGMFIRSSIGGEFLSNYGRYYQPKSYYNLGSRPITTYNQFSNYSSRWIWTNTIQYKKDFQKHGVDILVGQEALDQGFGYTIDASGQNPLLDNTNFIGLSTTESRTVEGSRLNNVRFQSFFGRVQYDYADRYLLSFVMRRDGSSRFGEDNRYGFFPSLTVGWRISSEKFMQNISFIDDLKIYSGLGVIGNSNNVDPDNQFTLFSTSIDASSYDITGTNQSAATGFYRSRIGNSSAKWERVETFNIGLDALLFGGSLDLNVEYWKKETNDLLFRVPRSVQIGYFASDPFVNVGEILNTGLDFSLAWRGHFKEVDFNLRINGGFLKNEIKSLTPRILNLPDRSQSYGSITPVLNMVGEPLSNFFGYEVLGIFQSAEDVDQAASQNGASPGRLRYKDQNEDGIITPDDRVPLGSPVPDFTGGLSLNLTYRNFNFSLSSTLSLGNEIFNLGRTRTDFYTNGGGAISSRIVNSWTVENSNAEIPIFEDIGTNFSTNAVSNSYFVEDGSYFRLQNISLSYNLPTQLIEGWNISQLRVFGSANNLFTITKYSGFDPSVGGLTDTNFGIDLGNIPITTSFVLGLNLKI